MVNTTRERIHQTLSIVDQRMRDWLSRRFLLKSLLVAVFLAYFFQFPTYRDLGTAPPALALLEMKEQVFDQIEYPPGSHLEKKTLRVIIPSIIKALGIQGVIGIHLLMVACNLILLLGVAVWLRRETGDTVLSFLVVCGFACIFPGTAGFADVKGWADMIPYLFLFGALMFRQPWILFFCVFFASLGDERALPGSLFVILWWVWKSDENRHPWTQLLRNHQVHAVMLSWISFFAMRWILTAVFSFETRLGVVGLTAILSLPIEYFSLGFWSAFEAFWLLFPTVIALLLLQGRGFYALLFTGALFLNIAGSFLIHDVTKSLAYSYLGILAGLVFLYHETRMRSEMRLFVAIISFVCIIAPTQYIYGAHWLYAPIPMWGFQWLKEWVLANRL
jgi:hypothetical protein